MLTHNTPLILLIKDLYISPMNKIIVFAVSLFTLVNFAHGQINILDLTNQNNTTETSWYKGNNIYATISITTYQKDLKDENNDLSHNLTIYFKNITNYPIHTRLKLGSFQDSINCLYMFDKPKVFGSDNLLLKYEGFIEVLEKTNNTLKLNFDLVPIDEKGKKFRYHYKGERTFKRDETREERYSKHIPIGLDNLIKKFDTSWQLEETGKGYWIGYTDEMYAIASQKDSAITKLVNYINSTENIHSKEGAVYCLHLIGIDSKIEGRFIEKFTNTKAREALLSLVSHKELTSLIASLLARDPWPSDLPVLCGVLKKGMNKTLINTLFRYSKAEMPFRENISTNTKSINVVLRDSSGAHPIGKIITVSEEKANEKPVRMGKNDKGLIRGDAITFDGSDQYTNKINQLNHGGNVFIQFSKNGRVARKFIPNESELMTLVKYFNCNSIDLKNSKCEELNSFFYDLFSLSDKKVDVFSYCNFRDNFFHYLNSPDEITLCDLDIARQRWLEFFKTKGY